jgi:hypothetical protein
MYIVKIKSFKSHQQLGVASHMVQLTVVKGGEKCIFLYDTKFSAIMLTCRKGVFLQSEVYLPRNP